MMVEEESVSTALSSVRHIPTSLCVQLRCRDTAVAPYVSTKQTQTRRVRATIRITQHANANSHNILV